MSDLSWMVWLEQRWRQVSVLPLDPLLKIHRHELSTTWLLFTRLSQFFGYQLLHSRPDCPYMLKLLIPVSKGNCLPSQKVGKKDESIKIMMAFGSQGLDRVGRRCSNSPAQAIICISDWEMMREICGHKAFGFWVSFQPRLYTFFLVSQVTVSSAPFCWRLLLEHCWLWLCLAPEGTLQIASFDILGRHNEAETC